MNKKHYVIIFLLFASLMSKAQSEVKGTVYDNESKETLIGASVIVKGTNKGVVTDLDGGFSIKVLKDEILTISYIGYTSQDIKIDGTTPISIFLVSDANQL